MTSGHPPATLPLSAQYRADAIVLRHRDLGEADRILTLFSAEHGKLRATARGVRKPTSRLGGHLEPLTRASVLITRGRSLDVITQAQASEMYPHARASVITLLHGLHMAELIDRFTQEQEPQRELFLHLVDALRRLDAGQPPAPLARAVEAQILGWAGFQPVLDRCASCGADAAGLSGPLFFSAQLGGMLCGACRSGQQAWTRPVSRETLHDLTALQREGSDAAARLSTREDAAADCEALLRWYLIYILEAPLETAAVLDRTRATLGPR